MASQAWPQWLTSYIEQLMRQDPQPEGHEDFERYLTGDNLALEYSLTPNQVPEATLESFYVSLGKDLVDAFLGMMVQRAPKPTALPDDFYEDFPIFDEVYGAVCSCYDCGFQRGRVGHA